MMDNKFMLNENREKFPLQFGSFGQSRIVAFTSSFLSSARWDESLASNDDLLAVPGPRRTVRVPSGPQFRAEEIKPLLLRRGSINTRQGEATTPEFSSWVLLVVELWREKVVCAYRNFSVAGSKCSIYVACFFKYAARYFEKVHAKVRWWPHCWKITH